MDEYDVTVTLTVRVSAEDIAAAQTQVGDQLRELFFAGQDVGAISEMRSIRVLPVWPGYKLPSAEEAAVLKEASDSPTVKRTRDYRES